MQVSEQLFGFNGYREVQPFAYTPFAIQLVYYQVGISMDGDSPWRARSEVLQYLENSCVFRHVVGHGTAVSDKAVFLQEDGTVTISDHHPERSGPSGINGSATSIGPSKVFIHDSPGVLP